MNSRMTSRRTTSFLRNGLLAVLRDLTPDEVLRAILRDNAEAPALQHPFQFPNGPRFTDNLAAPPDRWVMLSKGGPPLDRDFDRRPWLAGRFE